MMGWLCFTGLVCLIVGFVGGAMLAIWVNEYEK